jgi:Mn2+/Fe2+ NRAMP family transporter
MATLAENYLIGIGVTTGIVVVAYVLISIFAIRKRRKVKGDVSILGMIPIIHIALLFSGVKLPKWGKGTKDEIIEDIF